MQKKEKKAVAPMSEIRAAVVTSARLGHGLLEVSRRNGITTHQAWGILADSIDPLVERTYRRGHRDGKLAAMPNLPRVAA